MARGCVLAAVHAVNRHGHGCGRVQWQAKTVAHTCQRSPVRPPTDSIISWYRSLPSRVRSPTPANTEKPPVGKRGGTPGQLLSAPSGRGPLHAGGLKWAGF